MNEYELVIDVLRTLTREDIPPLQCAALAVMRSRSAIEEIQRRDAERSGVDCEHEGSGSEQRGLAQHTRRADGLDTEEVSA